MPPCHPKPGDDSVLAAFVDHEARNFTGDRYNRFVVELYSRVRSLLQRCACTEHTHARVFGWGREERCGGLAVLQY